MSPRGPRRPGAAAAGGTVEVWLEAGTGVGVSIWRQCYVPDRSKSIRATILVRNGPPTGGGALRASKLRRYTHCPLPTRSWLKPRLCYQAAKAANR